MQLDVISTPTPIPNAPSRVVHVTERTAWKTCRLYHSFSYTRGLVALQQHIGPMWFGTGVHYALATYYKLRNHPALVFDIWFKQHAAQALHAASSDEAERIEGFHLLGMEMLTAYYLWAQVNDGRWEVLGVELELSHEVAPGLMLTGTVDLLVRDLQNGKIWVVDHKTCATFLDPEALTFDDQMQVYLWLVWKVYKEVPGGAIYSMLRKKIPAEPMVLKKGGLSKAVSIDTTPEKYLRAIADNGLNVEDYRDVLQRLDQNEFFRREYIARSRRELQILDTQISDELREMTRANVPVFPTMTHDCVWSCQYRDLCRARATGGDVEYMIENTYKQVTDYDQRWLETHPRESGLDRPT